MGKTVSRSLGHLSDRCCCAAAPHVQFKALVGIFGEKRPCFRRARHGQKPEGTKTTGHHALGLGRYQIQRRLSGFGPGHEFLVQSR
jgi:hypothetical protein